MTREFLTVNFGLANILCLPTQLLPGISLRAMSSAWKTTLTLQKTNLSKQTSKRNPRICLVISKDHTFLTTLLAMRINSQHALGLSQVVPECTTQKICTKLKWIRLEPSSIIKRSCPASQFLITTNRSCESWPTVTLNPRKTRKNTQTWTRMVLTSKSTKKSFWTLWRCLRS